MADLVLRQILKDVSKKIGVSATIMGDGLFAAEPTEFVPCSSTLINECIGGGAAVGRIMEIYGDVQTGKTLLELDFLAHAQKMGALAYYQDAEYATSKDFAKKLCHIDDEALGHIHVKSQEQSWMVTEALIEASREEEDKRLLAIGLDSLAALASKAELEAELDESTQMLTSQKVIRRALKRLAEKICNQRSLFIFTNHEIEIPGAPAFAAKAKSWGGRAPRYWASTRIHLQTMGYEKVGDDVNAVRCGATIMKNRFDAPRRKVEYLINVSGPRIGIDDRASLVEYLNEKAALGSKKGWYEFEGKQYRKTQLIDDAWNNPEIYKALQTKAISVLKLAGGNPLSALSGETD
jgi:RecA/RadA recombinase